MLPGLRRGRRIGGVHRFIAANVRLRVQILGVPLELALELRIRIT